jgi:hypothetical protein
MRAKKSSRKQTKARKAMPSPRPKTKTLKLAKTLLPQATQLRSAIEDILGRTPKEVTIELSPGGTRAGDGSWDGNIYKYRY